MINSIRLQNFRSYKDNAFEFEVGVNIIVGPNACGKTSLLEAILVISRGSSFRAKDLDLIKFNKKWARVEADNDGHTRIVKIDSSVESPKTISIDSKEYKRLSPALKIPLVLFEPNDLLMLTSSPINRRDFLDNILVNSVTGYKSILAKYNRALAQRNALLKKINHSQLDKLFPWNIRLSELGGQVTKQRNALINKLNKQLPGIYKQLSSSNLKTKITYLTQLNVDGYETNLHRKLDSNTNEDLILGFTRFGPHRDDFVLTFNNHPTNIYASRGEIRSATLALKLAEHSMLKEISDHDPLFLLDDVFSELDGKRRKALAQYLRNHQSFITTTDADMAIKQFTKHKKILPLSLGGV